MFLNPSLALLSPPILPTPFWIMSSKWPPLGSWSSRTHSFPPCPALPLSRSNEQLRLDPVRVVCRYDLDSSCQDTKCLYPHLPPRCASPPLVTSSPALSPSQSDGTSCIASSQRSSSSSSVRPTGTSRLDHRLSALLQLVGDRSLEQQETL